METRGLFRISPGRAAAIAALVLVLLVSGFILLRGSSEREYFLIFDNAGQLVTGDDVQVAGRRIGSVKAIDLTDDRKAKVRIVVGKTFGPLKHGTRAVVRLTSLSGVANRYVAITPGSGEELKEGTVLGKGVTTAVVDLDEVLNTLDPRTQRNLQRVVKGFARQYQGKDRAKAAGKAIEYFNPMLSRTRELVAQLDKDESALSAFLVNSSKTVGALSSRDRELTELVTNANKTTRAIGSEEASLSKAIGTLPAALRKGSATFGNLRSTLDDVDRLVSVSKPATKELAAMLKELRPLVSSARPTIADLRRLTSAPGPSNDLVDATRNLPALQRVSTPAFKHSTKALRRAQPVLEFARPYTPDLVGWFRDFGQSTQAYDANGHYARVQPIFSAFSFSDDGNGGTLTAVPPSRRADGFQKGVMKRCPGSATQRAADGSSPFTDALKLGPEDCDPNAVVPGP